MPCIHDQDDHDLAVAQAIEGKNRRIKELESRWCYVAQALKELNETNPDYSYVRRLLESALPIQERRE